MTRSAFLALAATRELATTTTKRAQSKVSAKTKRARAGAHA
jgi:hypothetical protein